METALRDEGIEPTILSSLDQVQGALPLIHTQCCVFKVHGDYLDSRILNTPAELDQYPPEFNQRLDRIFDEFGLIVCGWSAKWDGALRKAIYRAPSRRFTTYWAVRGEPGDEAQRLINHRKARMIPIKDADAFFDTIQQHVESIEEFSRPHPLSTEAAVASLKRYLSSSEHKIRLADLIDTTVEQVLRAISGEAFELQETQQRNGVTARFRACESACSTLLAMASIGGSSAEDGHYYGWKRAMERLSTMSSSPKDDPLFDIAIRTYPGRLLLYALGLGAVESDKLQFLNRIFKTTVNFYLHSAGGYQRKDVLTTLFNVDITTRFQWGYLLEGMEKKYVPLSDWLNDALRQPLKQLIPDDENYSFIFDKLEILIALGFGYRNKRQPYWAPPGAFFNRKNNRERILAEIRESISQSHDRSPFVQCGIFGETSEECLQSLKNFESFVSDCINERRIPR